VFSANRAPQQRRKPQTSADEAALTAEIIALAKQYGP